MKNHTNAILFSAAIIISALLLGNAYMNRNKKEGSIVVTGLGKEDFTSDIIVWEGKFSKENTDLKNASSELEKDRIVIENYLNQNGIDNKNIVFSSVEIREKNRAIYTKEGNYSGEQFEGFILTQSIQITSKEVEKIENISRKITELLNQGIQLYSDAPRYYYSKLSDLKIKLISKATEDARERAKSISEKSGCDLGNLLSAQMGIFQITGQNSNEEFSWGGTFNTASKEKTASITMKLNYKVD